MAGLKRDFAWLLGSRLGVMATGVLTGGLINRALGPEGRGYLAEMQTWVGLLAAVFGLSIESAIYHFANKERYGSDDSRRFMTTLALACAFSAVASAALALLVKVWPDSVSGVTAAFLGPLALLLSLTMLGTALTVFLQAVRMVRLSALVGLAQGIFYATLIVGAYPLGRLDLGHVVGALILAQLATIVMVLGAGRRSSLLSRRFSFGLAGGMLAAGAKQHLGTVATFVYMKINQLIVFNVSGTEEAGLFAVALNLAFVMMVIPSTFQAALYPRVIHEADDFEVTVRSLRAGFFGWGAVALVMALAARPLLLIYGGGRFLPAVPMFRILMAASWFLPLSSLSAPFIVKAGAFTISSLSAVVLGLASIGLNLWLIPRYAGMGAAAATTGTCVIGFVMTLGLLRYVGGRSPLGFLSFPREARR